MIVVVADDLTGALDTGVKFIGSGQVRVGFIDGEGVRPNGGYASTGGEPWIQVWDTESRHETPCEAARRVRLAWRSSPCPTGILFKKIDSTMRGNVAAELRASLEETGKQWALVCPAYPAQGRTVKDGVLRVDGQAVAAVVQLIMEEGIEVVRHLSEVAQRRRGPLAVVPDAATPEDLARIVSEGMRAAPFDLRQGPLWVGSSGLAAALARGLGFREQTTSVPDSPWLWCRASQNGRSREQFRRLKGVLAASRQRVIVEEGGCPETSDTSLRALSTGGTVIWEAPAPRGALERKWAVRLGEACARMARAWCMRQHVPGPDGSVATPTGTRLAQPLTFFLTGGDLVYEMVRALGFPPLDLKGEVAPGVVVSELGGAVRGIQIVSKAGGFGSEDLLASLFQVAIEGRGRSSDRS